jgi:hypothetical protein
LPRKLFVRKVYPIVPPLLQFTIIEDISIVRLCYYLSNPYLKVRRALVVRTSNQLLQSVDSDLLFMHQTTTFAFILVTSK